MLHLVLYHPAIPQNTGTTARQCVGMNAHLHLIAPAFDLSEKAVRRAGLDYWPHLTLTVHDADEAFLDWLGEQEPWLVTKHGQQRYDAPAYRDSDVLILGNENTGLPHAWHERWAKRTVHLPMLGPIRSYNLANAAAVVLAQATLTAGLYDR